MEITSLNKAALLEYVNSPAFEHEENLPISFHRAISHVNNPRANVNDVLMIFAKEGEELVGYMGLLPDLLFAPNQPIVKVGWVSCAWVKESHRGRGITGELFTEAHFKWNGNLLCTDYVPATKKMYDSTGFFMERPLVKQGVRLYIKSDLQTILPSKSKLFSSNSLLLKALDAIGNSILSIYTSSLSFPIDHLDVEEVTEVDDEIESLIAKANGKGYFQRKKRELNWVLKEPWVVQNDDKADLHQKYYFSSSDRLFENRLFKLKGKDGSLKAFFFFTNRNGVVKLPYYYSDEGIGESAKIINHLLQKWDAKVFTTFHPRLVSALLESKTLSFHKKEVNRNFLIDKQLSKMMSFPNLFIQEGDGDSVFT